MARILFAILCALCNRARGSKIFDLVSSTMEGRVISMGAVSFGICCIAYLHTHDLTGLPVLFVLELALLLLWCVFAWEKYTSSAMGVSIDMKKAAFAPVDWIMAKLWASPKQGKQLRLWGLIATALRMTLFVPCVIAAALATGHPEGMLYAAFVPLLATPYYVLGYLFPDDGRVTMFSEMAVGVISSQIIYQSMGG